MPKVIGDIDEVLTTTRSVRRKLDFDRPVEREVIEECLRLAQQATMGSNQEDWRFVAVTDPERKGRIAELYRDVWVQTVEIPLRERRPGTVARLDPGVRVGGAAQAKQQRILESVKFLADNLERVPVLVFACSAKPVPRTPLGDAASGYYGSIIPITWSFQLALRSRGLGSVITTAHLYREEEAAELLGVPSGYVQACLVPVAYYTGDDFRPAVRHPVGDVTFVDRWGTRPPNV